MLVPKNILLRSIFCPKTLSFGNILGGKLGQFGGEVELFGGEASPAPPSLDETLIIIVWQLIELCFILFIIELLHFGDCIIFRFWLYLLCLSL